jgi:hypothetical protein
MTIKKHIDDYCKKIKEKNKIIHSPNSPSGHITKHRFFNSLKMFKEKDHGQFCTTIHFCHDVLAKRPTDESLPKKCNPQ